MRNSRWTCPQLSGFAKGAEGVHEVGGIVHGESWGREGPCVWTPPCCVVLESPLVVWAFLCERGGGPKKYCRAPGAWDRWKP